MVDNYTIKELVKLACPVCHKYDSWHIEYGNDFASCYSCRDLNSKYTASFVFNKEFKGLYYVAYVFDNISYVPYFDKFGAHIHSVIAKLKKRSFIHDKFEHDRILIPDTVHFYDMKRKAEKYFIDLRQENPCLAVAAGRG